jgi:hypothetical protein
LRRLNEKLRVGRRHLEALEEQVSRRGRSERKVLEAQRLAASDLPEVSQSLLVEIEQFLARLGRPADGAVFTSREAEGARQRCRRRGNRERDRRDCQEDSGDFRATTPGLVQLSLRPGTPGLSRTVEFPYSGPGRSKGNIRAIRGIS